MLHVALRQPAGRGDRRRGHRTARSWPSASACWRSPKACAAARIRGSSGAAFPAGSQHRHRRLGPRSGHGGAGAARLHRGRAALRVRVQHRRLPSRRRAGGSRSGHDAVHRLLQDLHHARDPDQRAHGARLARRAAGRAGGAAALRGGVGQHRGDGRVRRASGLPLPDVGLGRGPLFDVVVDRRVARRSPSAGATSSTSSPAATRWTSISAPRRGQRTCRR